MRLMMAAVFPSVPVSGDSEPACFTPRQQNTSELTLRWDSFPSEARNKRFLPAVAFAALCGSFLPPGDFVGVRIS